MPSHRLLRSIARSLPLLAIIASPPLAAAQDPAENPARTDFLAQCAACHGKDGDGLGTTELDRPARSFKDGGFSYGNTPSAIYRSMSFGIPGTPMPAFDAALSEEQRHALAKYVISLGPPQVETAVADRILEVTDAPIIARGKLPPIAEGTEETPRALLIGLNTGVSFQYRIDDVRLLGMRQGSFVERVDWTGRGGQPLKPLGKVTFLMEGGKPAATFIDDLGAPLRARLRRTSTLHKEARLIYDLQNASGQTVAEVTEILGVVSTSIGSGFTRYFQIHSMGAALELTARVVPYASSGQFQASYTVPDSVVDSSKRPLHSGGATCSVIPIGDGTFSWSVCSSRPGAKRNDPGVKISLAAGERTAFEIASGSCEESGSAVIRTLLEEVR
ncbi:MAG: mono/diheme cytochrome c family protein [Planctomycetota bacterium]|jgi:mono/diheme cytochrome c family protein